MASRSTARLEIRQAKLKDVRAIGDLVRRAYDDLPAYTQGEIRGQINNYPEGCFVALFDGAVVGYCASMRLDERVALSDHTWDEVTGNGFGSRHDPTGDWLYGYELCIDPAVRGSQVSIAHPEGFAIMQELIARGVIGDFRAPDILRFGLTPLYVGYADVWDAVAILADIMRTGAWDKPENRLRGVVT
jgi:hypothetical protein